MLSRGADRARPLRSIFPVGKSRQSVRVGIQSEPAQTPGGKQIHEPSHRILDWIHRISTKRSKRNKNGVDSTFIHVFREWHAGNFADTDGCDASSGVKHKSHRCVLCFRHTHLQWYTPRSYIAASGWRHLAPAFY